MGLNAAFLALIQRVFYGEPPGIPSAEALHRLYFRQSRGAELTTPTFDDAQLRDLNDAISPNGRLTTYFTVFGMALNGGRWPEVNVNFVARNYFDVVGVRAQYGRTFTEDDFASAGLPRPAIISDGLWQRLGRDSTILNQRLDLGGTRTVIVGIAPAEFRGVELDAVDVWTIPSNAPRPVDLIVRLARNANAAAVASSVQRVVRMKAMRERSADTAMVAFVGRIQVTKVGPGRLEQTGLIVRLAIVALLVFLIAVANAVNLLLVRGAEQSREVALRMALGASRGRVFAVAFAEIAILVVLAAAVAVGLGIWAHDMLRKLLFPDVHWNAPGLESLAVAGMSAACAVAISVAGVFPAWRASRSEAALALNSVISSRWHQRAKVRRVLIISQVALSVSLLLVAGLFVRSLLNVLSADIGYDVTRLTFGRVYNLSYSDAERGLSGVAARLRKLPAVEGTAIVTSAPFFGFSTIDSFSAADKSGLAAIRNGPVSWTGVSPDFFVTTGVRIVRGRGFQSEERDSKVVIVNENLAQQLWPSTSPLGRCLQFTGRRGTCYEVVGVVSNARRMGITEPPTPAVLFPFWGVPFPDRPVMDVLVRSDPSDVPIVARAIRQELAKAFPDHDILVSVLSDVLAPQHRPSRTIAVLVLALAILGTVITALGIYGEVRYAMTRRTRELGIRLALGATPGSLALSVVATEMRPVLAGMFLGLLMAFWIGRFLSALLFGVSPYDAPNALVVSSIVALSALLAIAIPASRVTRTNPAASLRYE